jgi:hypothetical protein
MKITSRSEFGYCIQRIIYTQNPDCVKTFPYDLHRGFNDEDLLNYLTEGGEKDVIFCLHERVFESPV